MKDTETAAVRGEMNDADPGAVCDAHRMTAGLYRAQRFGIDVSSIDLSQPVKATIQLCQMLDEQVFCSGLP